MSEEKKSFNLNTPTAVIIAGALIALAVIFSNSGNGISLNRGDSSEDPNQLLANIREVTPEDNIRGPLGAPITIIEYSDLECPFCKIFHYTMKDIMEAYSNGEVAWVFRHFPLDGLHRQARTEAEATECVAQIGGNEAFWGFLDKIYDNTDSGDSLDLKLLPFFATEVGVDLNTYNNCMENRLSQERVEADEANAVASGGTGTPFSILIDPNGNRYDLGGAIPFEILTEIIDEMLAEI